MDLKNLILEDMPAKKVKYDDEWDIYFDIKFLSKTKMSKMTSRHTRTKIDKKTHQPVEDLDIDALRRDMCEQCVKGWHNVTYRWLATIMPIDTSKIEDLDAEVEFSQDALQTVIEHSYNLDGWIFEVVRNCAQLNADTLEAEIKN